MAGFLWHPFDEGNANPNEVKTIVSLAFAIGLLTLEVRAKQLLTIAKDISTGSQIQKAKLGVKIYFPCHVVKSLDTDEIVSADLETSDLPEKVIAFYEKELQAERDATGMIMARNGNRTYLVSATRVGERTLVWIMGQK